MKLSLPSYLLNKLKLALFWAILVLVTGGVFFLGILTVEQNDFIQKLITPPKTKWEIFGFAPFWTLSQLENINWDILTTFAYFSLPVTANGTIDRDSYEWQVFQGEKLAELLEKAKTHQVRKIVTLTQMDPQTVEAFLTNPAAWEEIAYQSLQVLADKNLDGVNIDFEYISTNNDLRKNFSNFVETYSQILNENSPDPYITVAVLASSVRFNKIYDISYLAKITDGVFMMAYDFYYPGSTTIGPSAPLFGYNNGQGPFWYDVATAVEDFLKVTNSKKIIMGVPYYGWNYPAHDPKPKGRRVVQLEAFATTQEKVQNNKLLVTTPIGGWDSFAQVPWSGYFDENGWRVVYMEDKKSLAAKYDFAKEKDLAGVGIWALGYDGGDDKFWSLLSEKFRNPPPTTPHQLWTL